MPQVEAGRVEDTSALAIQRAGSGDTNAHQPVTWNALHAGELPHRLTQRLQPASPVSHPYLTGGKDASSRVHQSGAAPVAVQVDADDVHGLRAQLQRRGGTTTGIGHRRHLPHQTVGQQLGGDQRGAGPRQACAAGNLCPRQGLISQQPQHQLTVIFFGIVSVSCYNAHGLFSSSSPPERAVLLSVSIILYSA